MKMYRQIIIIVTISLILSVSCEKHSKRCSKENTIRLLSRPVYKFSVKLLDRVSFETGGHFVYSPIYSWMQLTALAEGARNATLHEILNTTGLTGIRRLHCYRRNFREIMNEINYNLELDSQRNSVIIIDKFYKAKKGFKNAVTKLDNTEVLAINFDQTEESAAEVNELFKVKTNALIDDVIDPYDFINRVLIMADAAYVKSAWKHPFKIALTDVQPFYSEDNVEIGKVNMMHQSGQFNFTEIGLINAKVIELPCKGEVSLLIFLPIEGSVFDIFYLLKHISLKGIYNSFEVKLVDVSLPRFEISTELTNLRELLLDMGVKRVFYPHRAQLKGISDYKLHASLMKQVANIEVTESYVQASVSSEPEYLLDPKEKVEFKVDRPFGYVLVDNTYDVILFAGMYSKPSAH